MRSSFQGYLYFLSLTTSWLGSSFSSITLQDELAHMRLLRSVRAFGSVLEASSFEAPQQLHDSR